MSPELDPKSRGELVRLLAARAAPMAPMPTDAEARLPKLAGIQAVLFDVYGTLFISGTGDIGLAQEAARGPAMVEALRAAGFTNTTDELGRLAADRLMDFIREVHRERIEAGFSWPEVDIRDVWRDLLNEVSAGGQLDPPRDDLQVLRLAVEYESRVNPVWPMPGFEETLTALRDKKLILGILSNAQFYTPLMFEALTGRDPAGRGFETDLCIWSFEHRVAKPAPSLFEEALARLRRRHAIPPAGTLVIGNDLLNDVAPAARMGCRTALFAGDRRSWRPRPGDPRCADMAPDAVLTSLPQLLACLE
jgi:putative hydrolase of the HAD superfamily